MTATRGSTPSPRTVRRQRKKAENRAGHAFVRFSTTAIKQAVFERDFDAATQAFSAAIRDREPWAVRTFFEIVGVLGAEQRVVVALVQQLGVRDEAELARLVQSGRRMESIAGDVLASLEEHRESAIQVLRLCHRERPEWLKPDLARLDTGAAEEDGDERDPHENGTLGS